MVNAKLKLDDREITLGDGITTLGRTSDNSVAFGSDDNVSRYHAEIEWRDGDFWLIDLNSSNGTTVNGNRVGDQRLKDGDKILLGGTSKLKFVVVEKKSEDESAAASRETETDAVEVTEEQKNQEEEIAADAPVTAKSKMPLMLGIAGAACGLALVCVVGAVLYSYSGGGSSGCEAKAVIVKPDNGATISDVTDIEVETENAECVSRAYFLVNDEEFANTTEQPFTAKLDPKQFAALSNGNLYPLKIVLEDAEGNKIVQPSDVALAFETIEIATPTPTPQIAEATPTPAPPKGQKTSIGDTQEMAKNLLKQFSGNFSYNISNPEFLQAVQKKTDEYRTAENYFARAAQYKDVINVAFVQDQNLDAPLAYILAMSRSKFNAQKQGANEGLWQLSQPFVTENAYNGQCGAETLSDASQRCAAVSTALYLKALLLGVFEGDVIYGVAAFGKSPQEANIWKATLPAERADFWKIIKDQNQRDAVASFFAAGIVAENPQKFGLKKDRPISELYRNLVGK